MTNGGVFQTRMQCASDAVRFFRLLEAGQARATYCEFPAVQVPPVGSRADPVPHPAMAVYRMSVEALRYPPKMYEREFGLMVTAEPSRQGNKRIGLRRMRSLYEAGVFRTTRVKVLKKGRAGWGFYFHGVLNPNEWRSIA